MGPGAAKGRRPAACRVMAVDDSLLSFLRCPRTGDELRLAEPRELAGYNESIEDGQLNNAAGQTLRQAMEGALLTVGGGWLYPVHDGIPVLLAEEAVPLVDSCD